VVGDVVMAGDRVGVIEKGSVGRDLATFSGAVEVGGRVGRDWLGAMERALLTGSVGRGAEIYAERLDVTATAVVGRDLRVHTRDEDNVTVAQGARLGGSLETLPPEHFQHDWRSRYAEPHFYAWLVLRLVAALGVGLLLHALLPGLFAGAIPTTRDFFLTTAKGFAAAVLTPLALVLVALTLVGVPLALLGAGLFVGAIYLAGILVATLIGRTLVPARGDSLRDFALVLLVGLGVLAVGEVLPGVSGVIHVLVVLTGLGLLIDRAMAHWRQRHA
jgi:hypothetical protein